jgi:hypothetical protein
MPMQQPLSAVARMERLKQIMTVAGRITPEFVATRPPSEAHSLLIRATRGCAWNRCVYCGLYRQMESSQRRVEDICLDIEMMALQVEQPVYRVFLGDGDALELGSDDMCAVLEYLRASFPELQRVTCYATAISIQRKSDQELARLRQAGLSRLHIGLESGDDQVLREVIKGVNAAEMIRAGQRVRTAGLALSFYVMLGLGGTDRWLEHIRGTARVLNQVDPEHIRLRTTAYDPQAPLFSLLNARAGEFLLKLPHGRRRDMQTPLGTLVEIRELLTHLSTTTGMMMADHTSNYIDDFVGKLPEDRARLLQQVETRIADVEAGRIRLPRLKAYK